MKLKRLLPIAFAFTMLNGANAQTDAERILYPQHFAPLTSSSPLRSPLTYDAAGRVTPSNTAGITIVKGRKYVKK